MDNSAQIEYWNGTAGEKWVRDADRLDQMLQPFADLVLSAAKSAEGERVIDIGCGNGALAFAAAASGAAVTGVDVSESLLGVARKRAADASSGAGFVQADASVWQPAVKMDVAISRFGVMFFAEPVAAFENIHSAMAPGGRLAFACWRPLAENDWAFTPLKVALPLLSAPPALPPAGTPGPFAFGDSNYVERILTSSGWSNVRITPWDGLIEVPGASPQETAAFMLEIGPLGRVIADQAADIEPIRQALVSALEEIADKDGRTRLKAAVWLVEATA